MIMEENEVKDTALCFGQGFRKVMLGTAARLFMSQAPKEIAPEIDVTEQFRIEYLGEDEKDPDCPVRIRSDISMLMHAADTAKKIGAEGLRYLTESKRGKVSSVQSQLDSLNVSDEELLATVKSRHLQSPAELLAWSEHLTDLAEDLSNQYKTMVENEKNKLETSAAADSGSDSSTSGTSAVS